MNNSAKSALQDYWRTYQTSYRTFLKKRIADQDELDQLDGLLDRVRQEYEDYAALIPGNTSKEVGHLLKQLSELKKGSLSDGEISQIQALLDRSCEKMDLFLERAERKQSLVGRMMKSRQNDFMQKAFTVPFVMCLLIAVATYVGIRLYLGR